MRACVHIAAMTLVLAGCRANPGFLLFDDGSDESAGTDVCEPQVKQPNDVCTPWKALPLWLVEGFNVAKSQLLADVPCEEFTEMLVKRVGDDLLQCDASCDDSCDGPRLDVSFAAKVAHIAPLLPAEGECALLWHRGQPNPDSESQTLCLTAGFALFDDEPEPRLRVAVAFNSTDPDPFAGVPGSPFTVTDAKQGVGDGFCLGMEQTACDADGATLKLLDFRFGECVVRSSQGQTVRELQVGGERHILENHSAYRCFSGGLNVYRWWLRRVI